MQMLCMAILMLRLSGDRLHFVLLLSYAAPHPRKVSNPAFDNRRAPAITLSLWIRTKLQCLCFNLMVWGIWEDLLVLSMGIILAILGPDQKVAVV